MYLYKPKAYKIHQITFFRFIKNITILIIFKMYFDISLFKPNIFCISLTIFYLYYQQITIHKPMK